MSTPGKQSRRYSADEALARLVAGNERFLRGEARFPPSRRKFSPSSRRPNSPYATILGCSDSRVPPELLFDAGFGELFVVRVAGNVISPEVMGSFQYAAVHLHTPLFVVLGHEGCGAVQAALASEVRGEARVRPHHGAAREHPARIAGRQAGRDAAGAARRGRRGQRALVDTPTARDT